MPARQPVRPAAPASDDGSGGGAPALQRGSLADLLRLARLAAWAYLGQGAPPPRQPRAPRGPSFRVMTYNLNRETAGSRQILAAIRAADADLACLQEVSPAWLEALREIAAAYPHVLHTLDRPDGEKVVLSRYPLDEVRFAPTADGAWFPQWLLRAATPAGAVEVGVVHLMPPAYGDARLGLRAFHDTLASRIREIRRLWPAGRPGRRTIVLGDFNEGDWGFAGDFLRGCGLADALSAFDRHTATWRMRIRGLGLRERLDHVYHTPDLRCVRAHVLRRGDSDHLPVVADFEPA